MSLRSSDALPCGKLGFFAIGVIAFALVAVQGCAEATTMGARTKDPGPVLDLGGLRADDAPRSASRERGERQVAARLQANSQDRGIHTMSCRRCGR